MVIRFIWIVKKIECCILSLVIFNMRYCEGLVAPLDVFARLQITVNILTNMVEKLQQIFVSVCSLGCLCREDIATLANWARKKTFMRGEVSLKMDKLDPL